MTRDELLNHLRRELSNREWSDLQPDARVGELEEMLDVLVERLEEIRAAYNDKTDADIFGALDDLAAAVSYFQADVGHFFSDTTRLANELRSALRQLQSEDSAEQIGIGWEASETYADGGQTVGPEDEEGGSPEQRDLFGDRSR